MIIYGTKIVSDVELPLELSLETQIRYEIEFSSEVPAFPEDATRYNMLLYKSQGRNIYIYSNKTLESYEAGQFFIYKINNVATFYWIAGNQTIFYSLDAKGNDYLLGFWFVQKLLPLYMSFEEMYNFIHAGSIEINEKAVLFIAPSMGGKSTMTDYFVTQGHTLISDDKVPVVLNDNTFLLTGSHPYHRPYRGFESFGYRAKYIISSFKPIHACYLLDKTDSQDSVTIAEVYGAEKFSMLMPNYMYNITSLKPKQLKLLAALANEIRIFRLKLPWDINRMHEVYNVICKHSLSIEK